MAKEPKEPGKTIWTAISEHLERSGIDPAELCCDAHGDLPKIKVVFVNSDLGESLRELGRSTRDQVVMVRVDSETCSKLDQWVATGIARSRSEAAALFIREGLYVRKIEMEKLGDALRDLEKAKKKLHREAMDIFGRDGIEEDPT